MLVVGEFGGVILVDGFVGRYGKWINVMIAMSKRKGRRRRRKKKDRRSPRGNSSESISDVRLTDATGVPP
jgi:hypothetical protein